MDTRQHADANRLAFDALAETYNARPWQQRLTKQILEALQSRSEWLGLEQHRENDNRSVMLLDYACGTGAASMALRPFVTQMRGMDLSEGMVKNYNEAMAQLGLSPEQAHATVGDLTDGSTFERNDGDFFDIAVVSLALHHVPDPGLLVKKLAKQLKPKTGVLVILDFLPFEHGHHHHGHRDSSLIASMAHTIKQHGFTEEQMIDLFTQAGLGDTGFQVDQQPAVMGDEASETNRRHIFVAKAVRSA